MKIKILGTRGEIEASAPYHSRHSGILINRELLFDLGEREFLGYRPDRIFFTHLHPDHAFFVRLLEKAAIDIPMYGPEPYRDEGIRIRKLALRTVLEGFDILPVPTMHSQRVASQAYLIEKGGKRILYTGDLAGIKGWYSRYFRHLDLVITEASFMRQGGMIRHRKESGEIFGHAGIPDLIDYFSRFCSHIVLVHFGSWFYRNIKAARQKIHRLALQHNVRIDAAHDGMEIEV
ncbi:MAG: MBL fold metallo-hydrolase [Desulfobulbaceae bacterium]|nr:MBL fold metallo-hydrolase [Desulfobulbaceae bacterium]